MEKLEKIGSLWANKDKNGTLYFSGNINGIGRIFIMKNKFKKEGSKEPDYIIYRGNNNPSPQKENALNMNDMLDEEIPF